MGADGKNREHIIDLMRQSRVRWLKNTEVCDILYNHRAYDFVLSPTAPVRPQGARDNRQISCLKRLRRAVGRIPLAGRGEARACVAPSNAPRVSSDPHPERFREPSRASRSTPHPARLPAPPPHRFAALLLVCHADHPAPPAGRIIVFLPPLPLGAAGTLYLFDRKAVRFFRKDGHDWQKKKDGKTVRETHEKLKVGNVELLNCYYAHSAEDNRFQRRCYWLLNSDEGLVLVHYLRVSDKSASMRRVMSGSSLQPALSDGPNGFRNLFGVPAIRRATPAPPAGGGQTQSGTFSVSGGAFSADASLGGGVVHPEYAAVSSHQNPHQSAQFYSREARRRRPRRRFRIASAVGAMVRRHHRWRRSERVRRERSRARGSDGDGHGRRCERSFDGIRLHRPAGVCATATRAKRRRRRSRQSPAARLRQPHVRRGNVHELQRIDGRVESDGRGGRRNGNRRRGDGDG